MSDPKVVIVVEGGVVTNVATSLPELTYRIIDIDAIKSGEQSFGVDLEPDAVGINVEKYSEEIIKDAAND
ncbi:MAG: hypothetical protein PHH85_02335 [Candidatus Methanoperedens sp.]|nr:hypothetical protein [Candidatus Methanoperedens sp.]